MLPSSWAATLGNRLHAATEPAPPSWLRRCGWRVELLGWHLLASILWHIGHRRALRFGEAIGALLPRLSPRRLRIATHDLRRVFAATKSNAEIDIIARRSLATLGGTLAEFLWLRRAQRSDVEALVELDAVARDAIRDARLRGRGVILVAIHFARWELMFLGFNLSGHPFTLVTRPLANPYLDDYLTRIRCRFGNSVLRTGNTRAMHAVLADGGMLLISLDHRSDRRHAAVVEFLGQATPLATGIARLALRNDATLLPIYALPLADGRLRIEIGPTLEPTITGDRQRDVEQITQAAADRLGAVIRDQPQHWMWSHRRLWRN